MHIISISPDHQHIWETFIFFFVDDDVVVVALFALSVSKNTFGLILDQIIMAVGSIFSLILYANAVCRVISQGFDFKRQEDYAGRVDLKLKLTSV